MRKMRADKMVAATSLLTLALVTAPHVAHAEEVTADGGVEAQSATAQEAAEDEAFMAAVSGVGLGETEGQPQQEAAEDEAFMAAVSGVGLGETEGQPQQEDEGNVEPSEDAAPQGEGSQAAPQADGTASAGSTSDTEMTEQPAIEGPAEQASLAVGAEQQDPQDASANAPVETKNGIPVLTIYVDESEDALARANANDPEHSYDGLGAMHTSHDHSVRCIGTVEFTVPDGFTSEYGPATTPSGRIELKYLRGRGNSTWGCDPKKAYKIAFKDKQDLFGMPKNKEWALLSSPWDRSMIRNRITYWLEEKKGGSEWVPRLVPVDLVIVGVVNGHEISCDELGCYYLSEFVEVKKGRLDMDVPDADATSVDPADEDNITGDYLLSIYSVGQNSDEPLNTVFNVDSGITFINHSPEFADGELTKGQIAQCNYIRDYLRELDRLIMAPGEIDAARHAAIAEMMDLDAAADYWWLQEFSNNDDGFRTSSNYLHKRRGGKLVWGPVWDFDVAWNESATHEGFDHTSFRWFDKLRWEDPYFVALLKERWNDPSTGLRARVVELTRDGSALDRYRDEIAAAGDANRSIWGYGADDARSTADVANQLKKWLGDRVAWVDENLDSIGCASADVPPTTQYEVGTPCADVPVTAMREVGTPCADVPVTAMREVGTPCADVPVSAMREVGTPCADVPVSVMREVGTPCADVPVTAVREVGTPCADVPVTAMREVGTPCADVPVTAMREVGTPCADVPLTSQRETVQSSEAGDANADKSAPKHVVDNASSIADVPMPAAGGTTVGSPAPKHAKTDISQNRTAAARASREDVQGKHAARRATAAETTDLHGHADTKAESAALPQTDDSARQRGMLACLAEAALLIAAGLGIRRRA